MGQPDQMLPAMASTHSTRTLQRRSSFGTQGQATANAQPTAGAAEGSQAPEQPPAPQSNIHAFFIDQHGGLVQQPVEEALRSAIFQVPVAQPSPGPSPAELAGLMGTAAEMKPKDLDNKDLLESPPTVGRKPKTKAKKSVSLARAAKRPLRRAASTKNLSLDDSRGHASENPSEQYTRDQRAAYLRFKTTVLRTRDRKVARKELMQMSTVNFHQCRDDVVAASGKKPTAHPEPVFKSLKVQTLKLQKKGLQTANSQPRFQEQRGAPKVFQDTLQVNKIHRNQICLKNPWIKKQIQAAQNAEATQSKESKKDASSK